jgi:hypothetical protein
MGFGCMFIHPPLLPRTRWAPHPPSSSCFGISLGFPRIEMVTNDVYVRVVFPNSPLLILQTLQSLADEQKRIPTKGGGGLHRECDSHIKLSAQVSSFPSPP